MAMCGHLNSVLLSLVLVLAIITHNVSSTSSTTTRSVATTTKATTTARPTTKLTTRAPATTTKKSVLSTTYRPPSVWHVDEFPNPMIDVQKCLNQHAPAFVCNPNHIIHKNEAEDIDDISRVTCDHTTCPCGQCNANCDGYTIGVAVLDDIDTTGGADQEVKKWSSSLLKDWELNGNCKDGRVQVVLATETGTISTSRGIKAEDKLSDKCIRDLYREITSDMEAERYGQGLTKLTTGYSNALRGLGCTTKSAASPLSVSAAGRYTTLWAAVVAMLLFCVI